MCIIIFKPAGRALPSKFTRYRCEFSNLDGFGMATPTSIYKTMNRNEFERELTAKNRKAEPCMIHCRIATHGSLKQSNCHPFYDDVSGVAFAHNGILNITPIGDMTDSETAFRTRFVPILREHGIDSEELKKAVDAIIGVSRFAFMDKTGHFKLFGHWYKSKEDGCYYSHLPW